MHRCTLGHIAVIRINKITLNHFNSKYSERIGKVTVSGGNISFNSVSHSVHSGMSCKFLGHSLCKLRVNNCNIRSNLEVSKRILDAFFIVSNNRESSNLGSGTGCGRNSTEACLLTKLGNPEYYTHLFKGNFRILILDPHSFCSINRRTTADSYDPVGLKFSHSLCTTHNGIN